MLVEVNQLGNTVLHDKVLTCVTLEEIFKLNQENPAVFSIMSRTVNLNNQLAFDLIYDNSSLPYHQKDQLRLYLIDAATREKTPPLNEPVDKEQILIKYKDHKNLLEKISHGCDAINYARDIIHKSSTHPSSNELPYHERISLNNQINNRRIEHLYKQRTLIRKASYTSFKDSTASNQLNFEITLDEKTTKKIFANKLQKIEESKAGNCEDYANLVFDYLISKRNIGIINWPCSIVDSMKGDHSYVKIGCGSSSIYIDAWAGKIFLEAEKNSELCDCRVLQYQNKIIKTVLLIYHPTLHVEIKHRQIYKHPVSIQYQADIHPALVELYPHFNTPNEKILFFFLNKEFKNAIHDCLIRVCDFKKMEHKKSVLFALFRNKWGIESLQINLLSLKKVDQVEPHVAKKMTTEQGFNYLLRKQDKRKFNLLTAYQKFTKDDTLLPEEKNSDEPIITSKSSQKLSNLGLFKSTEFTEKSIKRKQEDSPGSNSKYIKTT